MPSRISGGFNPFSLEHLFEQSAPPRRARRKRCRGGSCRGQDTFTPSRRSSGAGSPGSYGGFANFGGATNVGGAGNVGGAVAGSGALQTMINAALSQSGSAYKWGGMGPGGFDCSGLVAWAAAKAGIKLPHQSQAIRKMARPMSVEEAIRTPGALLFTNGHVAISLGDGRTIEAMNRKNGVRIGSARGRGWVAAGMIPGMG